MPLDQVLAPTSVREDAEPASSGTQTRSSLAAAACRLPPAVCLGLVLVLALILRLWSLDWQLPAVLHSDELKYVQTAAVSAGGRLSEPPDYRNPPLFRHVLELEFRLLTRLGYSLPGGPQTGLDRQSLAPFLLSARLNAALLGVASVGLLWLAGRRLLGEPGGLLAAALLAVNFLHVSFSHFALNDVPACFLLVAALLPSVALLERATLRALVLAGLLAGLACATKYNYGIALAIPFVAWLTQFPRGPFRRLVLGLLLLGLAAMVGLLIGLPELLWSPSDVREGLIQQAALGARRWRGQGDEPVLVLYGQTLIQACGWPTLLAAVGGLIVVWYRRSLLLFVLLAAPLLYLRVMGGQELFFARFALPLVPFVCLFAAAGATGGLPRAPARSHAHIHPQTLFATIRRLTPAALILALLALPLVSSIRLDFLAGQTDTRVLAERWLRDNLQPGTKVAAQTYALPMLLEDDDLSRIFRLTTFSALPDRQRLSQLTCAGNRYLLVSSFQEDRQAGLARPGESTGYDLLRERGQLLAAFPPGPDGAGVPVNIDDDALPFWELSRYARPGPTVEIYEVAIPACP